MKQEKSDHSHGARSKSVILERGLKPKKSFGQNFMVDQRVNVKFADAVFSFGDDVSVIEIGAGAGSLTHHLKTHARVVHAIERDRDLVPILRDEFADDIAQGRVIIHEADGARFDIGSIFAPSNTGVLVGNLPYHLTSSIIFLALAHRQHLKGCVFLVQKEVADRLVASPNNKQYGFLTVVLNLGFKLERVSNVDKSAFWPAPKVDSTIIKMTCGDYGIEKIDDVNRFVAFVRETFQKRRKKISTILSSTLSKDDLSKIVDPDLRPENLTPEQFIALYNLAMPPTKDCAGA